MIIDIHTHNYLPLDQHSAAARRNHIDYQVFLGGSHAGSYPPPDNVAESNDSTLETVRRNAGKSCGFCRLNPGNPTETVTAELRRCMANPEFRGVKITISLNYRSRQLDPMMELIREYGVPILCHCWYKTVQKYPEESDPSDVVDLARRHPEVQIIMAHVTGCAFRGIEDIADCPNVVVDTSGSQPEYGFVEYAVKRLGAERVVFGSDAPCRDFCSQLARVMEADISAADRELILFKNAERMLKL